MNASSFVYGQYQTDDIASFHNIGLTATETRPWITNYILVDNYVT